MHDAAARGHPLHAACMDHALMFGAVGVGQRALQNEGDRLEPPVRVRPKGQPAVVGRVNLRAVMIQKQKRIELIQSRPRQRPAGNQITDIIPMGRMLSDHTANGWGMG